MSGLQRATYTGVDNIMDAFEAIALDVPYYSVWYSKSELAYQWNNNDQDKGLQYLRENLQAAADSGTTDLFFIRLHPTKEDKYITNKTAYIACIPVRVNNIEATRYNGGTIVSGVPSNDLKLYDAIQDLKNTIPAQLEAKLNPIELRLLALEAETPEDKPLDLLGQITGVLQNRDLMDGVMGLINNFFPRKEFNPVAIGNVPQEQNEPVAAVSPVQIESPLSNDDLNIALDTALDRLELHCDLVKDLTLLADMAEQNPTMFKFLLDNLRSQKK